MINSRRGIYLLALIVALGSILAVGAWRSDSDSSTAATAEQVVAVDNGHVTVLDAQTGGIVHRFDETLRSQSYSMAVHAATNRLFISDLVWDGKDNVDHVRIYRTTDWNLETELPVPEIIRYLGTQSGLAPSVDGQVLYVYNYNERTRGTRPVRYWLSAYDLAAQEWLEPEVELPGCGASRLLPVAGSQLYVFCYDSSSVWNINVSEDASQLVAVDVAEHSLSSGRRLKSATAAVTDDKVYVVTENQEVHTFDAETLRSEQTVTEFAGVDRIVPYAPIGVLEQGNVVAVANGSPSEMTQGLSSKITLLDLSSGEVVDALQSTAPFRGLAFSSDGSSAFYVEVAGDHLEGVKLVRLDLDSGSETVLFEGSLSGRILVVH